MATTSTGHGSRAIVSTEPWWWTNSDKTYERVHVGATVTILSESGDEREVTTVGVDELDAGDAPVMALSVGQGGADGKGWRHGDGSRATRVRAPRDHCDSLDDLR
jgi:hypothetical protein